MDKENLTTMTTIKIKKDLVKKLKMLAIKNDLTLQEQIEILLKQALKSES